MRLGQYRDVLSLPGVRSVLLLGFLVRTPMFAGGLVLTVHIVSTLGRSYGEAGLVAAAFTLALAVSAPWRGRILDRAGLRRTVLPCLVVNSLAWTVAPFVPYEIVLPLAVLAGVFAVPTFSILRQAMIVAVPSERRRTALSLDSVFTELSFMIGPAVGIWAAVTWDTRWTLVVLQLGSVLAGTVLIVVDPPMRSDASAAGEPTSERGGSSRARPDDARSEGADGDGAPSGVPSLTDGVRAGGRWWDFSAASVLAAAGAAMVVLAGTDVAIVAALRSTGDEAAIGWVMAVWGAGSLLGGLVYGAWHRSISVSWLLGGLAVTTLPVALAGSLASLSVLLFACGFLCAPTITATIDSLSRLVHESRRGEAMGWHGSAMTTGNAIGAPFAGFAIDAGGWQWGFVSVSLVGLVVAVLAGVAPALRRLPALARQPEVEEVLR